MEHLQVHDPKIYSRATQNEHVLLKPEMYIGSIESSQREERVSDGKVMGFKNIMTSYGMERLFLEILSNASDNVDKSRRSNIDPGQIVVNISKTTISVKNNGLIIPIEKNEKENMYIPEMIFSLMLSGSHMDPTVDRTSAGTNGIGAKATNIFSKEFVVEIYDGKRRYLQKWMNNNSQKTIPLIEEIVLNEKPFVRIEYTLDFPRFKCENYSNDDIFLFTRHCVDTSFTSKIQIILNGIDISCQDIKTFSEYIFKDQNKLFHYEWPDSVKVNKRRNGTEDSDVFALPLVEMCLIDTPDASLVISFVNGLVTPDGGSHVECAYKSFSPKILEIVNKERRFLNLADVKQHVSIIVSVKVINPIYNSQSKTKLTKPNVKISVQDEEIKKMMKWNLIMRLYASIEAKQFKELKKTDGTNKRHIGITKCDEANRAGGKTGKDCTLMITEGDSAMGFTTQLISMIGDGGHDYIGAFPIRGKMLNVRNVKNILEIFENKEILELKQILGLEEQVDYSIPENFARLRYGKLLVCADADIDGIHIVGLVINIFDHLYPSLLKSGFVSFLRTPIVKISKKNGEKFYTLKQFENWREINPESKNWAPERFDYFKGLGTLTEQDVKEEIQGGLKVVALRYDDKAEETTDLAFNEDFANSRKEWIKGWTKEGTSFDHTPIESISDFINKELISYSKESNVRAIPKNMDTLKESQRKILYGALKLGGKLNKGKGMIVSRLAAAVAAESNYHHGELSCGETIIKMAQDFVGSNNLPYFEKNGNFGTRKRGGKDAGHPRYPFTKLEPWIRYIFRDEDEGILDFVIDNNMECEPVTYYPILPPGLFNGVCGIATGFSTDIPNYNPLDVSDWFKRKLKDTATAELVPWFKGFKGKIELISKIVSGFKCNSYKTYGKYEIKDGKIEITELPIGTWTKDYIDFLEDLVKDKKLKSYDDYSGTNDVKIFLYGYSGDVKDLRLVSSFGLSNMTVIDDISQVPNIFKKVNELLGSFYEKRIPIYEKRKEYQLKKLLEELLKLEAKRKFISDVVNDRLIIKNREIDEIHKDMDLLGHSHELLNIGIRHLSRSEIEKLEKEILKLKKEYEDLKIRSVKDIWYDEIVEFENFYKKKYT